MDQDEEEEEEEEPYVVVTISSGAQVPEATADTAPDTQMSAPRYHVRGAADDAADDQVVNLPVSGASMRQALLGEFSVGWRSGTSARQILAVRRVRPSGGGLLPGPALRP